LNGGEYTVLCGEPGAEKKLSGYPTVAGARAAVKIGFDNQLFSRAVIVRPAGTLDEPEFREEHIAPPPG
jgi:hypothetical protein